MTRTDADLLARITRLEDLEAIKQLKARYCEVCDDDHNPDAIVTLFTADGVWDGGDAIGRAEGHAELRRLFEGFGRNIRWSQHMAMNPIIEVNGDQAHARWYFFGPFTINGRSGGPEARWLTTRYHEHYVKRDGQWLYQELKVAGPGFNVSFAKGWAR